MLNILFFGQVKERLDCPQLERPYCADLDTLQAQLIDDGGELWREILGQDNIIRAVNQAVVAGNCDLQDGDEVAFFPPVTGG